ncbi:unnamed protein product [Acanthoscelides obtectus]|uniref:Uncharacterized protein n=1 Tax=Acanthoscelides obtectus TaxID=200917 RepID=A0A9P0Q3C3_ACAOB|nr:unnamed protein product [Acanthoscelides obtectus]CAK1631996.1 hypothetical protein AOBTE_LOCUS7290 [Acanthoscelides obtectus]
MSKELLLRIGIPPSVCQTFLLSRKLKADCVDKGSSHQKNI